ncbi:MAG: hypothetical protein OXG64_06060 [Chloroflexi bacterium]|nr:hypothetical protein [Chloroflexota bacterium]
MSAITFLARRIFNRLIALVTGWPVGDPSGNASEAGLLAQDDASAPPGSAGQRPRSRLSPGAEDAQAAHVRR